MIHERDWVMRLVKQLAELLIRVLKLRVERPDEAQRALEDGCLSLLGVEFSTLCLVDSASGAQLLQHVHKISVFAQLLEASGEVARASGNEALAVARLRHALEMSEEALKRRPGDVELLELNARLGRALREVQSSGR